VKARICVPERSNPVKVAAMEGLGAELVVAGARFDNARENAERLAAEHGYRCAAPLAAALKLRGKLRGRRVALVASGGNVSREQLLAVLA
jgi:threonine dehydratase